jgi:hypothetical protein
MTVLTSRAGVGREALESGRETPMRWMSSALAVDGITPICPFNRSVHYRWSGREGIERGNRLVWSAPPHRRHALGGRAGVSP